MIKLPLILITALAALTASAQQTSSQPASRQTETVPASCSFRHRPTREFVPPVDYHPVKLPEDFFNIGSEKLWTVIREPMVWQWAPHQPGHEQEVQPLTEKIFWYRADYDWRAEPQPRLTITGRRLDGLAPPLMVMTWQRRNAAPAQATNAIMDDSGKGAMLTGVYVPVPGCWEITGDYEGDKLSFVVWVEQPNRPEQ
jgi:hypothetical protein